jgi:collagenase-like PrtC family protease
MSRGALELVCPAGTPTAYRAAVDNGADTVYCGLRDETNARNFPGLNFSPEELHTAVSYAHKRGTKSIVAINTFATAGNVTPWKRAVASAADAGADAIVAADLAVLDHAANAYPDLRLHLSVQAAAGTPESIRFYVETFGVKRVVLPRILSIPEIKALIAEIDIEVEVFAFGGLCVMTEGRCDLSSYVTGRSPNLSGVCSPPESVTYSREGRCRSAKLAGLTINRENDGAALGYPTLCKGRFVSKGVTGHIFEDPVSLNTIDVLPALADAGVTALKIEGRQRGKAYVEKVTQEFRQAIDRLDAQHGAQRPSADLASLTEGQRQTVGAYKKTWR